MAKEGWLGLIGSRSRGPIIGALVTQRTLFQAQTALRVLEREKNIDEWSECLLGWRIENLFQSEVSTV